MYLFYEPQVAAGFLSEEESLHAVKVLRLQTGSCIHIVDGCGGLYRATLTFPHPKKCGFDIQEYFAAYGKRDYRLHVAIAPTKNIDRFEWFVEKAVEIGVDEITPLICQNSERKTIPQNRITKIIVAASKQSLKAFFPILHPPIDFNNFIENNHACSSRFIAHCGENPKNELATELNSKRDMLILIGPEGDFSTSEIQRANAKGYSSVSLGTSRLRTETAGVVACVLAANCR